MTSEGQLAIHFEPDRLPRAPTLRSQVQQVISQRGAFRGITEQSLKEEISQPKSVQDDEVMQLDEEEESDEETPQARQEKLWKSRDEMLQRLSYAQNEVLSALDFISLLLSNHSKTAQTSMSPALTAVVSPGTLDAKVVESKSLPEKTRTRLGKISEGWKSESFDSAADKLGKAANRLTDETQLQGKYWKQIAHLKNQGWAISRHPSDSRAIGVHIGFPESGPQFLSRGFVLLQQDHSGDLELDPRLISKTSEYTSFIVKRNNVETGAFTTASFGHGNSDINSRLLRARDDLFEEELFYEMSREARLIANQNVQTHAKGIEIFVSGDLSLKLVRSGIRNFSHLSSLDDQLAQLIGLSTRLLLIAEHAKIRERRAKPPLPMSLAPPVIPEYTILRPIVTHLRHQADVSNAYKMCQDCGEVYKHAGISLTSKIDRQSADITGSGPVNTRLLLGSTKSSINTSLQSGRSFVLGIETFLGAPLYGTGFESSAIEYPFGCSKPANFRNIDEVHNLLTHVLTFETVQAIETAAGQLAAKNLTWSWIRSRTGQMSVNKDNRTVAKVMVGFERSELQLTIVRTGKENSAGKTVYTWTKDGCRQFLPDGQTDAKDMKLHEVVAELNQKLSL